MRSSSESDPDFGHGSTLSESDDDFECVPFRPSTPNGSILNRDRIPRHLFRVYDSESFSTVDRDWAMSASASAEMPAEQSDICATTDRAATAAMINKHLRGEHVAAHDAHLVSWTSSLLYALACMYHLKATSRQGAQPSLDSIRLCVVDAHKLPQEVFIRDLDLMAAFKSYNQDLNALYDLRQSESYYGEYFSQDALCIQGYCQIFSAQKLFDNNIACLLPMATSLEKWSKQDDMSVEHIVDKLRQSHCIPHPEPLQDKDFQAVLDIAALFVPPAMLDMATHLLALKFRNMDDPRIVQLLQHPRIAHTWSKARYLSAPRNARVPFSYDMPEVDQTNRFTQHLISACRGTEVDAETIEAVLAQKTVATLQVETCADLALSKETSAVFLEEMKDIRARLLDLQTRMIAAKKYGA